MDKYIKKVKKKEVGEEFLRVVEKKRMLLQIALRKSHSIELL